MSRPSAGGNTETYLLSNVLRKGLQRDVVDGKACEVPQLWEALRQSGETDSGLTHWHGQGTAVGCLEPTKPTASLSLHMFCSPNGFRLTFT